METAHDLGTAILMVANDEGDYQPVAVVGTINEARELADDDFARRADNMETEFCPDAYTVWRRNFNGAFEAVWSITPEELMDGDPGTMAA